MDPARLTRAAGPVPGAVLYTRRGCSPCFALRRTASRAARRFGVSLLVVDIDDDAALLARYDREVPVLEFPDGRRICGRAAPGEVEAAFGAALASGVPRSRPGRRLPGWLARILGRADGRPGGAA